MDTNYENDPRAKVETIINSLTGIVITVISASTSIIASNLVIYTILRSRKGLRKSVYHRIMFGMNVADILQTIAIVCTTLPMPKDMIYDFKGIVIGSHASCQVQGFFVTFGCFSGILYNASLSIYYLCSINYNMMDRQFRKCFEPCLHIVAVSLGFAVAVGMALADSYHPSPTSKTWCGHSRYPYWCKKDDHSCHSNIISDKVAPIVAVGIAVLCIVVIIGAMTLIVLRLWQQRRSRILEQIEKYPSATSAQGAADNLLQNIKLITKHAMAYAIVNLVNILCVILLPIIMRTSSDVSKPSPFLQIIYLVLRPLTGLFNAIIFIILKVHGFLRTDPTQNTLSVMKRVLLGGAEAPDRIISDMFIVQQEDAIVNLRTVKNFHEDVDIEINQDNDDNEFKELGDCRFGNSKRDGQKPFNIRADVGEKISKASKEDTTSEYNVNMQMQMEDGKKNTINNNVVDEHGDHGLKNNSTSEVASNHRRSQDGQWSFGDIMSQDLSGFSS